jgi:ribonuclease PH
MRTERSHDRLRPLTISPGIVKPADGSVLIKLGETHVICTAKIVDGVPPWRRGSGQGWLTAEYAMLPAATSQRTSREVNRGRPGGRTHEIQRLIGRSLRAVTDLGMMGERTVHIDCDVIQADGGTRTASISGAYVALVLGLRKVGAVEGWDQLPLFEDLVAVSVGVVDERELLDLDYAEDSAASLDMNVVLTGAGRLVEVQATAEGAPFPREVLDRLLDLAAAGAAQIVAVQQDVLRESGV